MAVMKKIAGLIAGASAVAVIGVALVAWMLPGFTIAGFGSAILGALIVSVVSLFASAAIR